MASEDQTERKEDPCDPLVTSFQWGSILSKVKDQIPTMDSDTVYDGDEEDEDNFIFQRDESYLIPDLTEELEDLPVDEADLQKRFAFMRHPRKTWNEDQESPASQKGKSIPPVFQDQDGFDLLAGEKSIQQTKFPSESPLTEKKLREGISGVPLGIKKDKESLSSSPGMSPSVDSPSFDPFASVKERRQFIETKILSKATLGSPPKDAGNPGQKNNNNSTEKAEEIETEQGTVPAEHPQELTLVAFKDIEKWDLDKVLQDLKYQSGDSSWTSEMASSPSVNHEILRSRSQTRLMGKLEELSLKQSRVFFSEWRKDTVKPPQSIKCQGDRKDAPILANDRSPTPVELQCPPEPPTVYIDLREAISQKPELPTDETQSSSDSSADDDEDIEVTDKEKMEDKTKAFSQPSRNYTAKSFLLLQLRDFRKKMTQSSPTVPGEERKQNFKSPEKTDLLGVSSMELADSKSNIKSSLGCANDATRFPGEIGAEKGPCSELPQEAPEDKNSEYPR